MSRPSGRRRCSPEGLARSASISEGLPREEIFPQLQARPRLRPRHHYWRRARTRVEQRRHGRPDPSFEAREALGLWASWLCALTAACPAGCLGTVHGPSSWWRGLSVITEHRRTYPQRTLTSPLGLACAAAPLDLLRLRRQGLQVFDQVVLVLIAQPQAKDRVIMADHLQQGGKAAVMVEAPLLMGP